MKKKTLVIIIAILVAAAAAAGILYYVTHSKDTGTANASAEVVPWDVDLTEETEETKQEEQIYLPGYGGMTLAANTKEQTVSMGNPSANNCYFVITLKLKDGTELFTSDYLKPGEGLEKINLNQELEAGDYEAVIEYKCYSMDDKSPLNGGSTEFQLIVK